MARGFEEKSVMRVRGIDNKPVEALVTDLVQGALDVNLLNLAKANQRQAFLDALDGRPAILTKVSKINEESFFALAIDKNPSLFVHLTRAQYTNELAQKYIYNRLDADKPAKKKNSQEEPESPNVVVRKSLDDKVVFNYSYVTADGDELYYLDKELQVPVSLKSNIALALKLEDAVMLIDKLDTHITQLGEEKIKGVILDIIANQYKSYLNSYIAEKQIGYYTLCTSFTEIERGFSQTIAKVFAEYGISVSGFVIKSIAIPRDIQFKIEDQAFKIRQKRADVMADAEFSRVSLEAYEAKLAIHDKYRDQELTLTEYEKDLALKRYLTKVGRDRKDKVDHTININHEAEKLDDTLDKPDDIIPNLPIKPNLFRKRFILGAFTAALISTVALIANAGVGFIILGVSTLAFGTTAAFTHERFKNCEIEPDMAVAVHGDSAEFEYDNYINNQEA